MSVTTIVPPANKEKPKKSTFREWLDSALFAIIAAILYGEVIKNYDGNQDIKIEGNNILQNGKLRNSYTFKQDYYFMMGDNRHNSADSRYWVLYQKITL